MLAVVAAGAAAVGQPLMELIAGLAAAAVLAVDARPAPRTEITQLVFTERAKRLFAVTLAGPAAAVVIGAIVTVVLDADLPLAIAAALAVASVRRLRLGR